MTSILSRASFRLRYLAHRATLRRLDRNPIPDAPGEIRLFAVVRNEALRLPWFLAHYRRLGVDRFLFVDNDSTDDTRDLLLAEEDVHVFHTRASYRTSDYGCMWREVLFRDHGEQHWCLAVDADEMLVYPGCERLGLHGLVAVLDEERVLGMEAAWVQMYSGGPVRAAVLGRGEDPLRVCPFFDRDSAERGPHPRRFGVRHALHKAPLFFLREGGPRVWVGQHNFVWKDGVRRTEQVSGIRGAVLHFKFTSDLAERCEEERRRRQHFASVKKYGGFRRALAQDPDLSLAHEDSVLYEDSGQLTRLGILRSTPSLDRAISRAAGAGPDPARR